MLQTHIDALQRRVRVMKQINRLMLTLPEDDRGLTALELYRTYGRALTPAERSAEYRKRHTAVTDASRSRHASVTGEGPPGASQSRDESVTNGVTNCVTPDNAFLEPKASRNKNQNRQLREQATEILGFLNTKTNRNYRFIEANLTLIESRLRSGATVQECKAVIARQTRAWLTDPKMTTYLRPETLFNRTKFESYRGLGNSHENPTDTARDV